MAGTMQNGAGKRRFGFWRFSAVFALVSAALGIVAAVSFMLYCGAPERFPSFEGLDKRLQQSTIVLDWKGRKLGEIGNEKRVPVKFEDMPKHLVDAFTSSEDSNFWKHDGVDYLGQVRALVVNIKRRSFSQGASTITMQGVKNYLFEDKSKKLVRKGQEVLAAWQVERLYTKEQILTMYVNKINFGHAHYGVETASQFYFGLPVGKIDIAQAAMLAGLVQNPKHLSPVDHFDAATKRQRYVLGRMLATKKITQEQYDQAVAQKIEIKAKKGKAVTSPYQEILDEVRSYLVAEYGSMEAVSELGLTVWTSIDRDLQDFARLALKENTEKVRERAHLGATPQGAIIIIDNSTRQIRALVGGNPYKAAGINRAYLAQRQPGSLNKMFVYAAGLEAGRFNENTAFTDSMVTYVDDLGREWTPGNYHRDENTIVSVSALVALAKSSNTVAVKAICGTPYEYGPGDKLPQSHCFQHGLIRETITMAKNLGVSSPMPAVPSLVLGTNTVTPIEMLTAYATFADGGFYAKPVLITKIEGERAKPLPPVPGKRPAVSERTLVGMRHMLRATVTEGTGRRLEGRLPEAASGKTGTTSSYADAWFAGYTETLSGIVWIGFDNPAQKLTYCRGGGSRCDGETGGSAALPAWLNVVHFALTGKAAVGIYPQAKAAPGEEEELEEDSGDEEAAEMADSADVEAEASQPAAESGGESVAEEAAEEPAEEPSAPAAEEPAAEEPASSESSDDQASQ